MRQSSRPNSSEPPASQIAFVTIGQTPRVDIVPEMIAEMTAGRPDGTIRYLEFGVLDGLDEAALDALRAQPDEPSFATRLSDGREIVTSKSLTEERLNRLLHDIDHRGFELIVLLCTGTRIEPLHQTLVIEAQRIVDAVVAALSASCGTLGVMVPLERQIPDFPARHLLPNAAKLVAASPYSGEDIAARAAKLADCGLIILHCMGYSAAMLEVARKASGAPVLLSRRIVAGVIRQLLRD